MSQLSLFSPSTITPAKPIKKTAIVPAKPVKKADITPSELDIIASRLATYRKSKSFKESGYRALHRWAITQKKSVMIEVLNNLQAFNNLRVQAPNRLTLFAQKKQIYTAMLQRQLQKIGEVA